MQERAYCPYSKYRVGAALGKPRTAPSFSAANVENASYGLTICARTAVFTAVSAGARRFRRIVIATDSGAAQVRPAEACPAGAGRIRMELEVESVGPSQTKSLAHPRLVAGRLRRGAKARGEGVLARSQCFCPYWGCSPPARSSWRGRRSVLDLCPGTSPRRFATR